MDFIGFLSIYVLILLVWFKTEAFAEYGRLLNLQWTRAAEYYVVKSSDPTFTYFRFLQEYYNGFVVRLISCPICSGVWVGLLTSPLLAFTCGWWAPPLMTCLGLFLFYGLAMLMNKYGQ